MFMLPCTAPVALGCHISTFNLNQVKKNRQFVRPFVSDIPFTSIPSADAAKKNRFCRVRRKTSSAASQPASRVSSVDQVIYLYKQERISVDSGSWQQHHHSNSLTEMRERDQEGKQGLFGLRSDQLCRTCVSTRPVRAVQLHQEGKNSGKYAHLFLAPSSSMPCCC